MICQNAEKYLSNRPVAPNVTLRLLQRELAGHGPCGAGVHTSRAFSECLVPTHKVLQSEDTSLHIGKFTADGSALVCFSLQLDSLVWCEYLGPVPPPACHQQSISFHSFFRERWRLLLCSEPQQLCRDFCVSLQQGRFVLLASCTPLAARQSAAATPAAAAPNPPAAGGPQQPQQQQPQPQDATVFGGGQAPSQQRSDRLPSNDCCDVTTFHVVDVRSCIKVDERQFLQDYFDLSGNACISIHDNTLALTSIRHQTIHLLQVNTNGSLTDMQQVGPQCQPDDPVPIELAAAAEHDWQVQKQRERQQQQYWMHQQARALLPAKHCPASPALQEAQQGPLQQQQQQQQPQQGTSGQPAAQRQEPEGAAGGRLAGHVRRRDAADDGDGSDGSVERGPGGSGDDPGAAGSRGDIRRVRQRVAADQQQGNRPAQQHQAVDHPAPPRRGRGQQVLQPDLVRQQQATAPAVLRLPATTAVGDGGAAAAAAATSSALLDPGGQLITGLRQRLLAHLYRAINTHTPCDVAHNQRDFQHNFGVLSNLVVWRARLLGRHQLLVKLGAPTSGAAAAADANPSRVHFFGIYDVAITRFTGFWKGSSSQLLPRVLDPPRLLAASGDLTPVERCCAAALYPAGYPIGLEQQPPVPQQQQQPQQQQAAEQEGVETPGVAHRLSDQQMQHQQQQSSRRGAEQPVSRRDRSAQPAAPVAAGGAGVGAVSRVVGRHIAMAPAAAAARVAAADLAAVAPAAAPAGEGSHAPRRSTGAAVTAGAAAGNSNSSSSSKAARERLKFLRQVVLMVLPGLQSLSPSPYLDPHLFRYSKHLSPIIGLRNSPATPICFQLARHYPGFAPAVQQQEVLMPPTTAPAAQSPAATATLAARGSGGGRSTATGHQHHQLQQAAMLQLDVTQPPTVVHGREEVVRRQLHLFHPTDPFVLVVVQTPGQPATLNIYHRM